MSYVAGVADPLSEASRESQAADASVQQQWQMVLQLAVAYAASIMWFHEGVIGTWADIVDHDYLGAGSWLSARGILPEVGHVGTGERHLAVLAAAGWHTMIVMIGFVIGNTLKRMPLRQGVLLGFAVVAGVQIGLYHATVHGVEGDLWGVRNVARALRWPMGIPHSAHYLGLFGAFTQSGWLATAMGLASFDRRDVGYCPEVVARYLPRVVFFYGMTFFFFRFACLPFWDLLVRYSSLAPEGAARASADLSVWEFARLSSATHTLTIMLGITTANVAHGALRALGPAGAFAGNSAQVAVLAALTAAFSFAFSWWVSYALTAPVDHVVRFSQIFVGEDAVKQAAGQPWSLVHTIISSSYVTWFACGVCFEQCWGGSASNVSAETHGGHRGCGRSPGGLSPAILVSVVAFVVLPTAWRGGAFGFVAVVALLSPAARERRPRLPTAEPGAYKKVDWAAATADCPRTGDQYLVIGVGFVGISLVRRLLQRGETRVRAFDIAPHNPFEGDARVEYVRGNVCVTADLDKALAGVHTVYATFAMIRFWERMDFQAALSVNVNIQGTKNVVAACRKAGVRRFIQTSTSNVIASKFTARLEPRMTEEDAYVTRDTSHNHYGWTKAEAEKLVLDANSSEMLTVAVRPCSGVFGANDRTLVERFLRHRVLVMPVPKAKIDYIFCENVVLAHLKAEARLQEGAAGVAGEAFNVSNDEPVSFEELGIAIQRYHGPGLFRIPAPTLLLISLAHIVEWLQWAFKNKTAWLGPDLNITTPACYTTAGMSFAVSSEKARRLLKYKPLWTVDEAIQQSLADFAEQQSAKQKKE